MNHPFLHVEHSYAGRRKKKHVADDDEIEDEIDDDGFVESGKESEDDDDEGYLAKFGTGRFGRAFKVFRG